jgi:hypothetical protein
VIVGVGVLVGVNVTVGVKVSVGTDVGVLVAVLAIAGIEVGSGVGAAPHPDTSRLTSMEKDSTCLYILLFIFFSFAQHG